MRGTGAPGSARLWPDASRNPDQEPMLFPDNSDGKGALRNGSDGNAPVALEVFARKRYAASLDSGFSLDVRFAVPAGVTILFGGSGAGKTTTLGAVAGIVRPDEGRISVGGRMLFDSAEAVDVDISRRSVGYVFQDLALFPHLTVERNVRYGLGRLSRPERDRRVGEILESFRIAHLRRSMPGEISGGERQRTALARALVTHPAVLLLDEPLSALDAATKSRILDDLRSWNQAHRIPILYVTHSREEAFALGERVIILEGGKISASGSPQEVFGAPRTETVAQLAGFENIFDAKVVAVHEGAGTMTARLLPGQVHLEVPLARIEAGAGVRVGVRAGDILLAAGQPGRLSARNVLRGVITSLEESDFKVLARVDCGASFAVLLTPDACRSLALVPGQPVWLILKTHSCHLLRTDLA